MKLFVLSSMRENIYFLLFQLLFVVFFYLCVKNSTRFSFHVICRSLQWLRGSNKNVELELDTIRSNIRTSRINMDNNMNSNLSSLSRNGLPMKYSFDSIVTNVKKTLKNVRLVKPVLITCGLMIFQRFTGECRKFIRSSWNFYHMKQTNFFRCKLFRVLCRQDISTNVLWNESSWRVK